MGTLIDDRELAPKIRLDGTARARTADHTWLRIEPHLETAGITRVADVTDLDYVRIPVAMAVRPLSESLSVSQGKGASRQLAKISAAMESLETWHAENIGLPTVRAEHSSDDLGYDLTAHFGSHLCRPLLMDEVLEYYAATTMISGEPIAVPRGLVDISFARCDFRMNPFRETSSGLASGNEPDEAALHGLYEIFERDSTARLGAPGDRIPIDPRSVRDTHCAFLIERMMEAGWDLTLDAVPSRFGVPTFIASVFSHEYPLECAGAGTHGDSAIAMSRALTEAAQTRLTGISGTRDDLPVVPVWELLAVGPRQMNVVETRSVQEAEAECGFRSIDGATITDDLQEAARRALLVTGFEPVVLDLTAAGMRSDLAVVKVLLPGAVADRRGGIPGPSEMQAQRAG
ncbi:YcaO-like family protein [Nocardia cyriacigeorgica]|uniref:YcaO-like family protein n=1 Tax=Nocardia cyriacigeorgica TaxID=135487 RepID=UPI0013D040E3|nr:YcaO-like family protein [Nocardia cyriacigeorgica]MBF6438344.1 YcaO-like family protein [Nocardia cyriacigeorgica]MBF6456241.1 YcaO-like family protein [Nocardia cyriacigeorgica]MBF6477340.1 YcaO-like family protein [Nocardia cyriacigeorgica]MBF6551047.1 YcaO-like family protein [Nocardia cyriacigeorgica]NEW28006.1 hypothetical protein [Nocardia cyriacigeorgica]